MSSLWRSSAALCASSTARKRSSCGRDERPQLERFLAVLEAHKAALERQSEDIEAQLAELAAFEKRVRKQLGPRQKRSGRS